MSEGHSGGHLWARGTQRVEGEPGSGLTAERAIDGRVLSRGTLRYFRDSVAPQRAECRIIRYGVVCAESGMLYATPLAFAAMYNESVHRISTS